jgi:hypothetical protein
MDLALDRSGRIFVSQGFLGRVQLYGNLAPAAAPPAPPRSSSPPDTPSTP